MILATLAGTQEDTQQSEQSADPLHNRDAYRIRVRRRGRHRPIALRVRRTPGISCEPVRTAAKRRNARGGASVLPGASERFVSFIPSFGGMANSLCRPSLRSVVRGNSFLPPGQAYQQAVGQR